MHEIIYIFFFAMRNGKVIKSWNTDEVKLVTTHNSMKALEKENKNKDLQWDRDYTALG